MPSSKLKLSILNVLKEEGYINHFEVSTAEDGKKNIFIQLKYFQGHQRPRGIAVGSR